MLNQSIFKNYILERNTSLPELNGEGYVLRHKKTRARIVLVDNDDTNKVFSIAFRTPPSDDTGVAHILEHSVLCGSARFPAKDPFIELAKGSLNTFLNAMTYSDKTVYPIASCNAKDYHNLMHVYLDAVFFPNIYKKDQILKQEGWHYEIEDAKDELKFNGVVYNEMKGVFSSPDDLLERKIQETLLKDTPYACESGGDPDAIPTLTRENFLAFHTRYYHPSNSYIYLYGDVDFEKELAFIDEEYLSKFDYREVDSEVPMQEPFEKPQEAKATYSVSEDDDEDGIILSYNVVAGSSCDNELALALQILEYVLFSMPGAPVKKDLIDKGIGKDVDSYYDSGIQQPIFSIIVKNVKKEREQEFVSVVEASLERLKKSGINKKAIYSAINNFEFKFRESDFGRYPKGLVYGLNFLSSWLYDDNKAFELADSLRPLQALKEKVETGYFEELIDKYFLRNVHKAYVSLYPEKGKNEKMEKQLKEQLAQLKSKLTQKQLLFLVEDTRLLKEYQEAPSTEEELRAIPMLSLDDISTEVRPYKNKEMTIGELPVVTHDYFTNGIVYTDFYFDCAEIPKGMLPYMTLLVETFRYVDTKQYSYNELASEINLKIGGLSFQTGITPLLWKKDGYRPFFSIKMKCLEDQVCDGMTLLKEILFSSKLDDHKRLKEIISEIKIKMDTRIPAAGHMYAVNRALSYVDPMMSYKEESEGIGFYDFIKDLEKNFNEKKEILTQNLIQTAQCIFREENLTVGLTGDFNFKSLMEGQFKAFKEALYNTPCVKQIPIMIPQRKNEGFKTASKVQYVASAGRFETGELEYTGALRVLKTIFSYGYLWNKVRVTGGAYGCMCGFSRNGYGFFTSYRDPNLGATYDVYKGAGAYLREFTIQDRDMCKYIIGTISGMDQPMEPAALGDRSFQAYQAGFTIDMLKKERQQVLNTTEETIRSLAPYVEAIMDAETICAIGGEKKLEEEKELFHKLRNLNQ